MTRTARPSDDDAAVAPSAVSVLAVTAHRPDEIRVPLATTDLDVTLLELDDDVGPIERVASSHRATARAIARHDPDFLLLDCYETLGAPATWIAHRHDVPVVARLVGDPWRTLREERLDPALASRDLPTYLRHRLSDGLNRYVLGVADAFLPVSTDLARVVHRRTGCPRSRIGVVPVPTTTGSDAVGSADAARAALGVDTDCVLLTVTNLAFRAKRDGVERILPAVEPLLAADPELSYVVAGGGRYHDDVVAAIDDAVRSPSVRRRVHAPGHVEAVADLYALADVFAYVSTLDGYPNAVLEAQLAGLPVVANRAHGMVDQITDGETGYLVDPTTDDLRTRLDGLLSDPAERRRIGDAGQRRARRENDPATVGALMAAFFAGLAADGTPESPAVPSADPPP